jgi:hypothetical protein
MSENIDDKNGEVKNTLCTVVALQNVFHSKFQEFTQHKFLLRSFFTHGNIIGNVKF